MNLYYQHDFTESELHMLIDGLLFSRSVPYKQRKELIDKLGKLSSSYFNRRMNHMPGGSTWRRTIPNRRTQKLCR